MLGCVSRGKEEESKPALLRRRGPSQFEICRDQPPNVERKQSQQAERAEAHVAIDHLQDGPAVHFGKQAGIGEVDALDFAKRKIFERSAPRCG